ncbi:MAG: TRAP transporter substrate-binding protein [Rubrivivax sp.]|nr:TRAP transporter substrate-binding protein [Rubrivivax sp.]
MAARHLREWRLQASVLGAALLLGLGGAAPGVQAQRVLKQGSNSPPGTVYHRHWNEFKARLERASGGSLVVELNTSEPNEANLLSNLRRGRTDCAGVSLQGAATVLPEVAVLQLPFLFANLREVDHVYGQPALTERFRAAFAARGVHLLSWVEVGFTNLYGVKPIRSPADVAGRKLRATQSRASQQFIGASGGEPVVLAIADALPGLQTGLIAGGESGAIVYHALFAKVAPHYTLTQHSFDSGVVLCNKPWWDQLSPEQARQVAEAWDNASLIRAVRAENDRLVDTAASRGVQIHRPSEAELAQWRAVGERSGAAVMSSLPPEAAQLRQELLRSLATAPR